SESDTIALQALIARHTRRDGEAGFDQRLASCRIGSPPFTLLLSPLPGSEGCDGPSAIVFAADPAGAAPPTPVQLRHHFGLTAAEAALAVDIIRGQGLKACAKRLGISDPTARTQLQHIFEKTATRRQAELVRLLIASRLGIRQSAQ